VKRTTLGRAALPAAFVLVLGLSACGAANEEPSDSGDADTAAEGGGLTGSIAGAGASSQAAAMEGWVAGFNADNPDVTVNYDPVGSGGGREQFSSGGVDFAGSDAALDEEELAASAEACGGDVIQAPLYVSPIAVAFNLEGVDSLNLQPQVIAGIFAQQITNWNDPAIAEDNPDAELPDLAITPVNRSDESGTTENFAEYLAATAPDVWTFEVDGNWPVPGGEAGQGTSGVVGAIEGGDGTIGYADASQVAELGTVAVGVGEEFVEFSPEAAAAVVEASTRVDEASETDFTYELARDTTEAGTYPIVLLSYTVACTTYADQEQADLVKAFLSYMASAEGQDAAAENAGSAPISDGVRELVTPAIDSISVAG